ncbi:MAG: ATP-binding protein [Gammaproteobacteria bacterium]|nr:ATP-binding protein [Gammaproteobacteria bacterium]
MKALSFKQLYDASPNLVVFTDLDGKIIYVNPQYKLIESPHTSEYIGRPFTEILSHGANPSYSSSSFEQDLKNIQSGMSTTKEISHFHNDGVLHTYLSTLFPCINDSGQIVALGCSGVDITILKEKGEERERGLERELEKTRMDLSLAHNIAGIGSWEWHFKDQKLKWSEEIFDLFEISPNEIDVSTESFLRLVHPDDRTVVEYKLNILLEQMEFESFEYRIQLPDGSTRDMRVYPKLEHDDNGDPFRLYGFVLDITEKKYNINEKFKLEKRMQQSQKLESIGYLTGRITHELNNMLACILGYADLSQHALKHDQTEKLENYINEIDTAGKKARDFVKKMLVFSHSQIDTGKGKPEPISVTRSVIDIVKTLKSTLPSNVDLSLQLEEDLPNIVMDSTALSQAITNLYANAIDALKDRSNGRINISLDLFDNSENTCSSCHKYFRGTYLKLSIKDNGSGIKPGTKNIIFDPFFTTKEFGSGDGLGLSEVHSIIHRQGGHLFMESENGYDTTFNLLFTVADSEPEVSHIYSKTSGATL